MVILEQVKLLESKVAKTIDLVKELTGMNADLQRQVDGERERSAALEEQLRQLKAEIDRVEEGILATLDRLNKFEDAVERNFPVPHSTAPGEAVGSFESEAGPEEPGAEPEVSEGEKTGDGEIEIF